MRYGLTHILFFLFIFFSQTSFGQSNPKPSTKADTLLQVYDALMKDTLCFEVYYEKLGQMIGDYDQHWQKIYVLRKSPHEYYQFVSQYFYPEDSTKKPSQIYIGNETRLVWVDQVAKEIKGKARSSKVNWSPMSPLGILGKAPFFNKVLQDSLLKAPYISRSSTNAVTIPVGKAEFVYDFQQKTPVSLRFFEDRTIYRHTYTIHDNDVCHGTFNNVLLEYGSYEKNYWKRDDSLLIRDYDGLMQYEFLNESKLVTTLAQEVDQFTLIAFWHRSCGPCLGFMTELPEFHSVLEEYNIKVIGVNIPDKPDHEKIRSLIEPNRAYYSHLSFYHKETSQLRVGGYPKFILVDGTGKMIYYQPGYGKALYKRIKKNLKKYEKRKKE